MWEKNKPKQFAFQTALRASAYGARKAGFTRQARVKPYLVFLLALWLALVIPLGNAAAQANGPQTHKIYVPIVTNGPAPLPFRNGDFEQGKSSGWSQSSTQGFDLIVPNGIAPGVSPHNGSWMAWLGGANNEISTLSQQVTIQASAPYLVFWNWVASVDDCGYDKAYVKIDDSPVVSYDLCAAHNTSGWTRVSVSLASQAGKTVTLALVVQTDGAKNSNWYLDDIAFSASASDRER